ncbi:MAG: head-tail connector protein [Lactococcus sp.]
MSDYLELIEVKTHLRVLHARDDNYIQLLTKAALESVENFIDRPLSELEDGGGEIPSSLKAAALLMVGDMYSNRSDVVIGTIVAINPTTERLMLPFRKMGV